MRERKKLLFSSNALVEKKQLSKFSKKQQMFPYQNRIPSHIHFRSSKFLLGCVHRYGTYSNNKRWVYLCLSCTVNLFLESFDPSEKGYISQHNH